MRRLTTAALIALSLLSAEPTADLWLGGDVYLGSGVEQPLTRLAPQLERAAGIVNLEGPVGSVPPPGDAGLRLLNAPTALRALAQAGVRVAGIANNHSADAGPKGAAQTRVALGQAGILPAGAGALELKGVRIAVTAHDLTGGVPAQLEDELRRARGGADVLVSTFHVTGPALYLPSSELRAAVEIAARVGAQVIASHGTHALGPVERRGGSVIAWGLGNLIFNCDCTDDRDALVLRVRLARSGVVSAEVIPIRAGLRGEGAVPAPDGPLLLDLLEGLGSHFLQRGEDRARF
jgi:poly-gamma-glutamate capsule biosynthesis protein CapA/YwtB (metallophosphatase superfamily)